MQIPTSLFFEVQTFISFSVQEALKNLLENKHLYQKQEIIKPNILSTNPRIREIYNNKKDQEIIELFDRFFSDSPFYEWSFLNPDETIAPYSFDYNRISVEANISIDPPTVKIFCKNCQRIEPYNNTQNGLCINGFGKSCLTQVFYLLYQCQSCKSMPEVFLLRRDGLNISLHGRTPIEFVDVPGFIPKNHRDFFSDSIIAFNSGQVLAGIFLLRTFIEQYTRNVTNNQDSVDLDEIFSSYNKLLTKSVVEEFPSLKKIYDDLSICIHKADGSEEVFTKSKNDIEMHFDAKRLHKIKNYPV